MDESLQACNEPGLDRSEPAQGGIESTRGGIEPTRACSDPARGKGKIWTAAFLSVFFANAALQMGTQMSNTLVAVYAEFLGADPTLIGFIVGVFAYTALAFKFVSAPILDAFNRPRTVGICMFAIAVSIVSFGLVTQPELLVWGRLLQGAALAFTATGCLTVASNLLPEERLGAGLGYFSLAQTAAMVIGPAVGLVLSSVIGYPATFFVCAASATLAGVMMLCIREPVADYKPLHFSLKSMVAKEAIPPAALNGAMAVPFLCVNSFLVVYGVQQGVPKELMGIYFTVNAVIMLLGRPVVGALCDKHRITTVLLPCMALFTVSMLVTAVADSIVLFIVAAVFASLGFGSAAPAFQTACIRNAPSERRGAASSTSYIFTDIASITGPVVGGLIATNFSYQVMWFVMAGFIVFTMVVTVLLRNIIDRS